MRQFDFYFMYLQFVPNIWYFCSPLRHLYTFSFFFLKGVNYPKPEYIRLERNLNVLLDQKNSIYIFVELMKRLNYPHKIKKITEKRIVQGTKY